MRALSFTCLTICLLVCVLVVAILGLGKEIERLEVSWQGADGIPLWITSTESKGVTGRVRTVLHVRTKSGDLTAQMDDDCPVSQFRLVRKGEWILAVNGVYVIGGYRSRDGTIVGENAWEKLPFTIWRRSGEELARGAKRSDDCSAPAGFPRISDDN